MTQSELLSLVSRHGTPLYIYDKKVLQQQAQTLIDDASLAFGLTIRYAAKANMYPGILKLFHAQGLSFDASSSYEAQRLIEQGIPAQSISLSSQQPAHNLPELINQGVVYTATSLHQLELFCKLSKRPDKVSVRINPGVGSGHNNRTTTGGINSSFGIWHEYIPDILAIADQYKVTIDRIHIHYGSGADPAIWSKVIVSALEIVGKFPDATILDIGGGYKIKRYEQEQETDMSLVLGQFAKQLKIFHENTGRKIHLEIEPGTWLVAHAGTLLAEVVDVVDTGKNGHTFLRLNTGMNDLIRPAMYGAQHRIEVLNSNSHQQEYIVVGHNCETGDVLTPAPGDPEGLAPRRLKKASIGDIVAIYDTGAYGASFAVHDYNSFPSAKEILV